MNSNNLAPSKKISTLSMMLGVSLMLGYIEAMIPLGFGVPGIKLGLANLVTVLVLYIFGPVSCFLIGIIRVVLSGLLFGNMAMIIYSMTGLVLSIIVMIIAKKIKAFSMIGVSMLGGVFHNIGQLIVAAFITDVDAIWYYAAVLLVSGLICGFIIGTVSKLVLKYIRRWLLL